MNAQDLLPLDGPWLYVDLSRPWHRLGQAPNRYAVRRAATGYIQVEVLRRYASAYRKDTWKPLRGDGPARRDAIEAALKQAAAELPAEEAEPEAEEEAAAEAEEAEPASHPEEDAREERRRAFRQLLQDHIEASGFWPSDEAGEPRIEAWIAAGQTVVWPDGVSLVIHQDGRRTGVRLRLPRLVIDAMREEMLAATRDEVAELEKRLERAYALVPQLREAQQEARALRAQLRDVRAALAGAEGGS